MGRPLPECEVAGIRECQARGLTRYETIRETGHHWKAVKKYWQEGEPTVSHAPNPGDGIPVYRSRPDNTFIFGLSGDQHFGSKQERPDVAEKLYDEFARAGVDLVFNGGNWIEGEASFNRQDVKVHGFQNQIDHLVGSFPKRDGLQTFAIAGADHEGWYCKQFGVDVGSHAENAFKAKGRTDWHYIGYIETYIRLVNSNSGKSCLAVLRHPGKGSTKARSYKPQTIVDAYEYENKPEVLLLGHYHKVDFTYHRRTWIYQGGCTQDRTVWASQGDLVPELGGLIGCLKQDPETGRINRAGVDIIRYYADGPTNGQYSHSGEVNQPARFCNA